LGLNPKRDHRRPRYVLKLPKLKKGGIMSKTVIKKSATIYSVKNGEFLITAKIYDKNRKVTMYNEYHEKEFMFNKSNSITLRVMAELFEEVADLMEGLKEYEK